MPIGSPPCTSFCRWQALNAARLDGLHRAALRGELHVRFCCKLYELQAEAGRYYIHDHPANAMSWQLEEVKELLRTDGARQVVSDQC